MVEPAVLRGGRQTRLVVLTALAAMALMTSMLATVSAEAADKAHKIPQVPPGVGLFWAKALKGHDQVLVASDSSVKTSKTTVTAWQRTRAGWVRVGTWKGLSGSAGWGKTRQGDRKSPIGVYGLTAAGGFEKTPDTKMPYKRDKKRYKLFKNKIRVFAYVVAIDYNRKAGTAPTSTYYPAGYRKGGHIWLHVAHGGDTAGCLGIKKSGMIDVLAWLDPARKPVILMGPDSQVTRSR